MKQERLLTAIGGIDDRYILEAAPCCLSEGSRKRRKNFFLPRLEVLAATIALLLAVAVPVRAELVNGYISNLMAPLYGDVQTELVEAIGKPVEAVVTYGDYTLSADAVIGDKYNIAVVYSLTRTDGAQLEEGLCFDSYSNTARSGTGGGSYSCHLSEDKTRISVVEEWTSAAWLRLNRRATAIFTDLICLDAKTGERTLVQEGTWELKYMIRYEDSSVKVPTHHTVVQDASGKQYKIHRILISPIAIHLDLTAPNRPGFYITEENPYRNFTVSLILHDGTVKNLKDPNMASHGDMDDDTHDADYGAWFLEPIPLDQIRAVEICGTLFPLTA